MIVAWSYLVENHLVKALYPQSPYRNDISQPLPVTCSESSDTSSGITGNRDGKNRFIERDISGKVE